MEIVLLLVVVIAWLVVRGMDRGEVMRRLEQQDAEILRLRDLVAALKRPSETQSKSVSEEVTIPLVAQRPPLVARVAPMAVPATLTPEPATLTPEHATIMPEPVHTAPPPPAFSPGVPVERRSLEQTLGVNWLNRLGIALLVFGVAFYLAYQVTRFGPTGKVMLAYAVSVVLLGGGLWLERKPQYRIFARAGIGGGWALGFLTTYAMYFFPATQVLTSQAVDLGLLLCVGVGMVAHSLRYRSQVVTGIAFLLAFSTVTISQVSAFSLLASAVLALGLEFVCVREEWYGLEIAGVLAAYGNHFLWLDRTLDGYGGAGHAFPLWGQSTALLILFWAIFRAGYCIRKPSDETAEGMSGLVAVLNSIGLLALMKYQSFHPEYAFRALLGLGAAEMVLAFVMRRRRAPAFAVLVTIGSALLVAAIPFRFHGATWSLLWIFEGEALFVCGILLKERLMRWLGMIAQLLVVGQMLAMHADMVFVAQPLLQRTDGWLSIALTFFVAAAALWANAEWLGREDEEHTRYQAALVVCSFAAAVCAVFGLWVMVPGWTLVLLWALLALMLVEAGLRTRSAGLRLEGYGALGAAILRLVIVNFQSGTPAGWTDPRLVAGVGVVAACLLMYERLGRAVEMADARERSLAGKVLMWCASALVSSILYMELPEAWLAAGWACFALVLAGAALVRDGARLRSKAVVLAVMVVGRALVVNLAPVLFEGGVIWNRIAFFTAVALLAAGIPVGFLLRRTKIAERHWLGAMLDHVEQVFFFATLALLVAWVPADLHKGMMTVGWIGLGVAVFMAALAAGERSFRLSGLGLLMLGVAKLLVVDVWGLPATERYLLLIGVGVALLLVSFLYSRFGERLKEYL